MSMESSKHTRERSRVIPQDYEKTSDISVLKLLQADGTAFVVRWVDSPFPPDETLAVPSLCLFSKHGGIVIQRTLSTLS